MLKVVVLSALLPGAALAESLVAVKTLPARAVIGPADVTIVAAEIPGALPDAAAAIGKETVRTIYAGRPIRTEDVSAPAIVERNMRVALVFRSGGLTILAEGRALARGGVGDTIPVMNVASRSTVQGLIAVDGTVLVGGQK